jgi:predicted  nucleic acid-binding Zn-ribbon protein
MCTSVSAGSAKADFEQDLRSVLSVDDRGFQEKVLSDPMYWIKACTDSQEADKADKNLQEADKLYEDLRKIYKAYEELYEEFCTGVRKIESEFTAKMVSVTEDDPEAPVKRSLYLLELSRDLYGKVFNYADRAWYGLVDDEKGEKIFKDVNSLILLECFYVFERRILGLSRFVIQRRTEKTLGLFDYFNTKDREPDLKVVAGILKPFAKGDAENELKSDDENSTLVQKNNTFMRTFCEFLYKNEGALEEAKASFGTRFLAYWLEVRKPGEVIDYLNSLTMLPWDFIDALRTLSRDASDRVARMTEIKVSAELKKEALPFFKGEKDVGELLKAAESFRIKEKEARKSEQEAFAKAKAEREKFEREIIENKKALKTKKDELYKLQESGTEISDKRKELENEIQKLNETVETLKTKINKLPYPSTKSKHKMQRGAAKEGITKDEHDMAVFANYVQLPDKCGAFQRAFLYYQTIMWNVFTDDATTMKPYGQKIYVDLKITEPLLTNDFEEEYIRLTAGS